LPHCDVLVDNSLLRLRALSEGLTLRESRRDFYESFLKKRKEIYNLNRVEVPFSDFASKVLDTYWQRIYAIPEEFVLKSTQAYLIEKVRGTTIGRLDVNNLDLLNSEINYLQNRQSLLDEANLLQNSKLGRRISGRSVESGVPNQKASEEINNYFVSPVFGNTYYHQDERPLPLEVSIELPDVLEKLKLPRLKKSEVFKTVPTSLDVSQRDKLEIFLEKNQSCSREYLYEFIASIEKETRDSDVHIFWTFRSIENMFDIRHEPVESDSDDDSEHSVKSPMDDIDRMVELGLIDIVDEDEYSINGEQQDEELAISDESSGGNDSDRAIDQLDSF